MLRKMIDLLLRTVDQCVIAENVKSMNNVQLNCGDSSVLNSFV